MVIRNNESPTSAIRAFVTDGGGTIPALLERFPELRGDEELVSTFDPHVILGVGLSKEAVDAIWGLQYTEGLSLVADFGREVYERDWFPSRDGKPLPLITIPEPEQYTEYVWLPTLLRPFDLPIFLKTMGLAH